ncbi:hypothetical protein FB45DRAFT_1067628 [Roridomyces roridus]|uniref:Uncharacterized protein n=1 Tax=Roridomyces roridus TaxID=1738132 RepID=A0AAD7B1W7_9AGAR|nr:hypothetical protein FB45DRAFT_1067628 [Roridomyces roridus]
MTTNENAHDTEQLQVALYATTPDTRRRYDKPTLTQLEYIDKVIPAGLRCLPACTSSTSSSTKAWSRHTHPEGRPYFVLVSIKFPSLKILTEDWIPSASASATHTRVVQKIELGLGLLRTGGMDMQNVNLEAFIEVQDGGGGEPYAFYYLINHASRTIFWLQEVGFEGIGLRDSTSDELRDMQLEELYWKHVEHFPMHLGPDGLGKDRFDALACVLAHGKIDQLTSRDSTFAFTAEKCAEFLDVLNTSQDRTADGHVIWIYARLWHELLDARFYTFYNDKNARITRSQAVVAADGGHPSAASSARIFSGLASLLSFNVSRKYTCKLNDIFVDQVVYEGVWDAFTARCIKDWSVTLHGTTMCLLGHGFLFLLPTHNPAVATISAGLLVSSFLTAKILLHRYDSLKDLNAVQAYEYLNNTCSPAYKFQLVALTLALPEALQIWGLLAFLANLGIIFSGYFGMVVTLAVGAVVGLLGLGVLPAR